MSVPIRIPMATYDTGWKDAIEVWRHFGSRHDREPVQPLIKLRFEEGEDATPTVYFLSRAEAEELAHALLAQLEVTR